MRFQKGFSQIILLVVVILVISVLGGGIFYYQKIKKAPVVAPKEEPFQEEKESEISPSPEVEVKDSFQQENLPQESQTETPGAEDQTPVSPEKEKLEEPVKIESDERVEEEQIEIKEVKDLVLLKKEGYVKDGTSSCTIKVGNEYWMYIGGITLFVSKDGLNFVEETKGGLIFDDTLDMIGNPTVIKLKDERYRMFYEGRKIFEYKEERKLYSAVSSNGKNWEKEGLRYEDASDSGKPGEIMVSVPDVIRIDDKLYLYYTRGKTLAMAVSENEGMTWEKIKDITFEGIKLGMDPDIVKVGDGYKLFFTTSDNPDLLKATKVWIISASSLDGINFELNKDFKLEPDPGKNNAVDADVIYLGEGKYRIYYGQAIEHFGFDYGLYSAILEEK